MYLYCLKGNRGKKAMELMKAGGFLAVYNISGGLPDGKKQVCPLSPETTGSRTLPY
jgi:rhodanese-related sulfurtransferase